MREQGDADTPTVCTQGGIRECEDCPAQAVAAEFANTAKVDPKNECVRGTVPLYSLKNKNERREFLKLVNILLYFLPWEALPICGLNSGNV